MKKCLLLVYFMLILSLASNAQINHFYEIKLTYYFGNYSYDHILVKPTSVGDKIKNVPGGVIAEVRSFDNQVLNVTFFGMPLLIVYDDVDEANQRIIGGKSVKLNMTETIIKIPYYENAKEINIYDEDVKKVLTIDVSEFSKTSFLQEETKVTTEEQNQREQIQVKRAITKKNYLIYGSLLLLIALITFITFLINKLKRKQYQ